MAYQSINPASGETLARFDSWTDSKLQGTLTAVVKATPLWAATPMADRCDLLKNLAATLRKLNTKLARLITLEMGKLYSESEAEVEKCAVACDYYAQNALAFLGDEVISSDARKSYIAYQPLGTVLAIMPWNFPIWQVFRFAAPSLVAGNTALLKHASNVPQCAQAIEDVFLSAGFPENVFRTLFIDSGKVEQVIADPGVHAVTITGSEAAGRKVAEAAGRHLKKIVLELGGSDPFIVCEDADLDAAVEGAVAGRFLNCGQSCIASKRFIVVSRIAEKFTGKFVSAVEKLKPGDPMDPGARLAPMARVDLCEELHQQVQESLAKGAKILTGGKIEKGSGAYYPATVLSHVAHGMRAYHEELFGPVASIIEAKDEADAIRIANDTRFGLGASIWSTDDTRAERIARQIQSGAVFINGFVKSDPRLPFGGIKASGYGRELSLLGIREFVNAKTVWIR